MTIIKTITKQDFINEFKTWDTYKDKFSYEALGALYDYLDDMSETTEKPIELDVVAIACEFTEYENLNELLEAYNPYVKTNTSPFKTLEDFEAKTEVITILNTERIIIRNF